MINSLSTLTKVLQEYKMEINAKKIKTTVVTKAKVIPLVRLKIHNNSIE